MIFFPYLEGKKMQEKELKKKPKVFIQLDLSDAEVFYCNDFFSTSKADTLFDSLEKEINWTVFPVKYMENC